MDKETVIINDQLFYTIEPSKKQYPIVKNADVYSVTLFNDKAEVLRWDLHLTDECRYVLAFEVSPAFRDDRWKEVIGSIPAGVLERFNRPKVVWLNVSHDIAERSGAFYDALSEWDSKGILETKVIYSHGALNKIFKV